MSKIMLVNVTHVEESRVAIVDDGVLAAYEIETLNRTSLKGNIHNAIVESVHPSLEAAFLKIGPDLKGFLPMDEVNFRLLPARSDNRKQGRIGQHLHQGQKIMAQVVREPFAGKPPSVSTYFSLPGRYLVLMPGVDSSGISRKIDDSSQRDRLKQIVEELNAPEGFGLIVRTAGLGQTKTELQRDLRYLLRLWESIQRGSRASEFPSLVYREADVVIRTIRDHLTSDIEEVWIDSPETYEKALAFASDVMPKRAKTLKLYTGDKPLFNKFNLEEQIERIYKRRVPLPSGGEIVIDGTEALTAIDVNTARAKRSGDAEEGALQTNLEAAVEIARQLRLRDLGGLIVIDFIDLNSTRNKKKVEKQVKDALRGDRARVDITTISKLGLMEIARQRIKGAKMAASYATCPACDGYGLVKNVETAAIAVLRKLQTRIAGRDVGRVRVALPSEVATWLSNNKREDLWRLERRHQVVIEIEPRAAMLRHENEFTAVPRDRTEEPAARATPVIEEAPPVPAVLAPAAAAKARVETAAPAAAANGDGEPEERAPEAREGAAAAAGNGEAPGGEEAGRTRRRRRRRRKGRGGQGAVDAAAPRAEGGDPAAAPPQPPREQEREQERERETPDRPTEVEYVVPRGVRSDELMPAAAAGSRAGGGGGGGGGGQRGRRRKRSSHRG